MGEFDSRAPPQDHHDQKAGDDQARLIEDRVNQEPQSSPGNRDLGMPATNSSIILPAAHGLLSVASIATRFGLNVAQHSVKFGFAIPKTILSNVIPNQLGPISTVIQSSLALAEFSTLTALQLAQGITSTSLDLATISISELDLLIKSYQLSQPSLPSIDSLKLCLILIRHHWDKINTPHSTDLPPQVEPFRLFSALRALSTWALLQQLTNHIQVTQLLASHLIPIKPRSEELDRNGDPNPSEPVTDPEAHREVVKLQFKKYINLCISSYGGLGHILFGPGPQAPPSRSTERGMIIESPSNLNGPISRGDQSPTRNFKVWDLFWGKHDHDLVGQHGELVKELELDQPLGPEDEQLAKELEDLLPPPPIQSTGIEESGDQDLPSTDGDASTRIDNTNKVQPWIDSIEKIDSGSAALEGETGDWQLDIGAEKTKNSISHEVQDEPSFRESNLEPHDQDVDPDNPQRVPVPKQEPGITSRSQPPRYFILVDRANGTVIVCLRGTFSLDDLTTDLTCDRQTFDPQVFWDEACWEDDHQLDLNSGIAYDNSNRKKQTFEVHKGFFEVAKNLVGMHSSPSEHNHQNLGRKQTKFMKTLLSVLKRHNQESLSEQDREDPTPNPSRSQFKKIEFVGHSLGAGVAILLGLMLADPRTGKSTKLGGLPEGIAIKVYAICPPCTTSKALTELSREMIKTLVNSNDLVSRLSFDHILNLKTLMTWIQFYESRPDHPDLSFSNGNDCDRRSGIWKNLLEVFSRLKFFQSKYNLNYNEAHEQFHHEDQMRIDKELLLKDEVWLIGMRNLLESKIQKAHQVDVLLPAGEIYWILQGQLCLVKESKCQEIFNRIELDLHMLSDHLLNQVKNKFEACS